jgi:hypothetical protein
MENLMRRKEKLVIVVAIEPLPAEEHVEHRLKQWLKLGLRRFRLRCREIVGAPKVDPGVPDREKSPAS